MSAPPATSSRPWWVASRSVPSPGSYPAPCTWVSSSAVAPATAVAAAGAGPVFEHPARAAVRTAAASTRTGPGHSAGPGDRDGELATDVSGDEPTHGVGHLV